MSESISLPGLFVALLLPWLCGSIWISWLLRRTGRCNAFIVAGQGYFLGIFFTTLVIRLWDMVGFGLHFWGVAAVVALIGALGILLQVRRTTAFMTRGNAESVPRWHLGVGMFFVALILWRHVILYQELLLRPLYAWDAWMNWAPKAIVWFQHGALVDFVSPQQWLQHGGEEAYTLGNRRASTYPETVPLIQLWCMLGVGTWDHSTIYLPWILVPIGLGLGLFGHLRLAGVPFLPAVMACYLLLSLPFLNVHSVLAGYADIWLASAFGLAVCALYESRRSQHWAFTVLWLLLALLCSQLKNPGVVLALIVLFFGVHSWLGLKPKQEFAVLLLVGIVCALALVVGSGIEIPYLGRISVAAGAIEVEKFGRFELEYHPVGFSFLQTFFIMIQWNLLWYLLLPYVVYCIYRIAVLRRSSPEFLPVLASVAFVVIVFAFTKHYTGALNFSTLNRALLFSVPAMIFCIFLSFRKHDTSS